MSLGLNYCLNSGTVFWLKDPKAQMWLEEWWNSASMKYSDPSNLFPSKWRKRWPWEQAMMYPIYNKYKDNIMRLSFPNSSMLPWTSSKNPNSQYPTDSVDPWCFSHWPGADCFITHHCASPTQKKKIISLYSETITFKVNINPVIISLN